jgi:hypothetical protein
MRHRARHSSGAGAPEQEEDDAEVCDRACFTLPPEHAFLLLDADVPGAFQLSVGSVRDEPKIADAFRTGAGVGWHEHDAGVYEGCERFFRPGYAMNLVS